jgi:hypothetical protein
MLKDIQIYNIRMKNYNKSRIYKIWCEDEGVDQIYVGSSKNLTNRTRSHKHACSDSSHKSYNLPLYIYIRENGGFENFYVHTLQKFPCKNKKQLQDREQHWIDKLKPTLNCKRANSTIESNKKNRQEFYNVQIKCTNCDKYYSKSNKTRHLQSKYCINYNSNQNV